jgi:hypothetical protein
MALFAGGPVSVTECPFHQLPFLPPQQKSWHRHSVFAPPTKKCLAFTIQL